jgi:HAD domain in Swiss Army Knife RNA repair proteins
MSVCRDFAVSSPTDDAARPLLLVDIDGVISLFGRPPGVQQERLASDGSPLDGSFHSIEGMPHFLSSTAAAHLLSLAPLFDLVWASGWEERANEHLPHLLGLPERLPFLRFPRDAAVAGAGGMPPAVGSSGPQTTLAHWKLQSIDSYAGQRPLAWIDDAFNPACHDWAAGRAAATLLVQTEPEHGLTSREAQLLEQWARELAAG